MSAPITLVGRIGGPLELKFAQSGKAVTTFSVVTERRQLNRQTNEWESDLRRGGGASGSATRDEPLLLRSRKGAAVILTGRVEEETWNDKKSGASGRR